MYDMKLYPDSLVPNVNYKGEIDIPTLLEKHDFHISRRIKEPKEKSVYEEDGVWYLNRDALKEIDHEMSVNLLGAGFHIEHTKFRQVGQASEAWHEGEAVDKMQYSQDVYEENDSFPILYRGKNLVGKKVPYSRPVQSISNEQNELLAKIQEIAKAKLSSQDSIDIKAELGLKHSPSRLNYWHLILQIKPSHDEQAMKNTKPTWKKDLMKIVRRDFLSSIEMPDPSFTPETIEEEWYLIRP